MVQLKEVVRKSAPTDVSSVTSDEKVVKPRGFRVEISKKGVKKRQISTIFLSALSILSIGIHWYSE